MIDLFLCASDADALASAFPWLCFEDEDGERVWLTSGEGFSFDPIGVLVLDPGDENNAPTYAQGWHGNLRCSKELETKVPVEMIVSPATPMRVWA